jgi:hypothetical protein
LITNGESTAFTMDVPGAGTMIVRAPSLRVTAYPVDPPPSVAQFHTLAVSPMGASWVRPRSDLEQALCDNDFIEYGSPTAIEAEPVAQGRLSAMLVTASLEEPHVQLELEAPEPDFGVVAMLDDGEHPLMFAPVSFAAPAALDPRWSGYVPLGVEPPSTHAPARFRFVIPARAMQPAASAAGLVRGLSVGSTIKRAVVRLFKFRFVKELLDKAADKVVEWIASKVEAKKKDEGFKCFFENFAKLTPAAVQQRVQPGKRALLLVHGIFSSAPASFGPLRENPTVCSHLRDVYQDRVLAWDHFTVSKDTLQNAEEMLSSLPDKVSLDIVCHSRGAVVTRAALEHPELAALRAQKLADVRKVFFVAGAHRGSALARRNNIDKLLNTFSLVGAEAGGIVLELVFAVLKVLAHAVTDLPGIRDMDPELSPVLPKINAEGMLHADKYLALRANFDYASKLGLRLLDFGADKIFANVPNDLVVPYAGAIGWDERLDTSEGAFIYNYGSDTGAQNVVFHTNFFRQPDVAKLLIAELHA